MTNPAPDASKPSVIFFGTPDFAVPALKALALCPSFELLAAVTQPDRPAGRGQQLSAPPVKRYCQENNIPVFQPKSLKNLALTKAQDGAILQGQKSSAELAELFNAHRPVDVCVTCAYGKILPQALLNVARCGMINIHPSLLPRWRGAAPLQRAIFEGDRSTGVSLMQVDEGLDTGPVFCAAEVSITEQDTLEVLHDNLAQLGAELLIDNLDSILSGALSAQTQQESQATYAEKWTTEDARIQWHEAPQRSVLRIRASNPIPGARSSFAGEDVKIFSAHEFPDQNFPKLPPGSIVESNQAELIVAAGDSKYIAIDEMQFPGKKRLPIKEILRGKKFNIGEQFS